MGLIYIIMFPDGHYYIGMTETTIEERMWKHKYRAKNEKNLVSKYLLSQGEGAVVEILETIECSRTELFELEKKYIRERRFDEMCLNIIHSFRKSKNNSL